MNKLLKYFFTYQNVDILNDDQKRVKIELKEENLIVSEEESINNQNELDELNP
jgi:regulatory protein YycI of two-component signal transduction system YycFG